MGIGRRAGSGPPDPDDVAAAEDTAARILTGAAQTEVSLRRRLEQRGYTATAARAAALTMAQRGYLDDTAFAESVAGRRLRRGYGRAVVAAELRARGVGEAPLHQALRGVGMDDEREAALRLARRLWDRHERVEDDRRVARVAGALARRGFDGETVRSVLRTLCEPATGTAD